MNWPEDIAKTRRYRWRASCHVTYKTKKKLKRRIGDLALEFFYSSSQSLGGNASSLLKVTILYNIGVVDVKFIFLNQ